VAVLRAFFLFHCFSISRSVFLLEEIMKYGNIEIGEKGDFTVSLFRGAYFSNFNSER
jgi:hypothetical protein